MSLVFMVSVLVGLALHPSGVLGASGPARHEGGGGTPPRHVEQIRCLAETMVRVATRSARQDRHVPIAEYLAPEASRDVFGSMERGAGVETQVAAREPWLREGLLNLPPPSAA